MASLFSRIARFNISKDLFVKFRTLNDFLSWQLLIQLNVKVVASPCFSPRRIFSFRFDIKYGQ